MTQEDKELLLKDLCARLPYGVKIDIPDLFDSTKNNIEVLKEIFCGDDCEFRCNDSGILIKRVKPYLFPLSSMTEEQKRELLTLTGYEARCEESCGFDSWGFYVNIVGEYKYEDNQESIILYPDDIGIDWLNKNNFDYRGLIPKGLANDATGLNIY